MKKLKLWVVLAICSTTMLFTSCNKEDENDNNNSTNIPTEFNIDRQILKIEETYGSFYKATFDITDKNNVFYGKLEMKGYQSERYYYLNHWVVNNAKVGDDLSKDWTIYLQVIINNTIYEYSHSLETPPQTGKLIIQSIDKSKCLLTVKFENFIVIDTYNSTKTINGILTFYYDNFKIQ